MEVCFCGHKVLFVLTWWAKDEGRRFKSKVKDMMMMKGEVALEGGIVKRGDDGDQGKSELVSSCSRV